MESQEMEKWIREDRIQFIQAMQREKRRLGLFYLIAFMVALTSLAYWGNGNHLAVEVPANTVQSSTGQTMFSVSEDEHQQVLQLLNRKEAETVSLRKQLADEHARRLLADKMIQTSNANNMKLVRQLKDLQASVPPLPVIQEALRKESATDAGFKAAVLRNFGPIKVEVRE